MLRAVAALAALDLLSAIAITAPMVPFNGGPSFGPAVPNSSSPMVPNAIGAAAPPPTGAILLTDNTSFILQTDNSSLICLAGATC